MIIYENKFTSIIVITFLFHIHQKMLAPTIKLAILAAKYFFAEFL